MLRILILFLLTNCVLLENECSFPLYKPPTSIEGGLISRSTSKTYSFLRVYFDSKDKTSIKSVYDHLDKVGGIVPKIIGAFKDDYYSYCHLFYQNVYRMDYKIYLNTYSIKSTFMKMIKALKKINFRKMITFDKDSFAYSPSTQTFLFTDLVTLIKSIDLPPGVDLENYAEEYFSNWVYDNEIPLLRSDNVKISPNFAKDKKLPYFEEYKLRYKEDLIEKSFKVEESIDFNPEKGASNQLEVKITKEKGSSTLTASLNSKTKTFSFDDGKNSFMIFLCQNSPKETIECMNLDEKNGGANLVWQFNIKANQRIDVEVQDADCPKESLDLKYFKVNLVLTDDNYPGIVPESEFLLTLNKDTEYDDYFVICETNHRDLRGIQARYFDVGVKSIKMNSKPVINKTGHKIFQVLPSTFEYYHTKCLGSSKKLFIIEKEQQDKNKYLLIDKQKDNSDISLVLIDKTPRIDRRVMMSCNKPLNFPDLFFILNPEIDTKKNSRLHSYPRRSFLTQDISSERFSNEYCVHYDEPSKSYSIDYELESVNIEQGAELDFKYNFFSHSKVFITYQGENGKKLDADLVFLTKKDNKLFNEVDFKNFEFLEFGQNKLYISIERVSESDYQVRTFFISQYYNFLEIPKLFDNVLILSGKPSKIIYNKKNSCIFNDPGEFVLKETNASYMNDSEIIFSIKIPDFEGCKPILESVTDTEGNQNIKITCSLIKKLMFWTPVGKDFNFLLLTEGLKRVFYNFVSFKNRYI